MNASTFLQRLLRTMLATAALCGAAAALPALAAVADLADEPLANATTTPILPNIMLDLDDSGSMVWDYMPDYVRFMSDQTFNAACRGPVSNGNGNQSPLVVCEQGDPPYFASAFNGLYYNPAISYGWPVNADGTPKADHKGNTSYGSPWDKVPSDGYGVLAVEKNHAEAASKSPCKGPIVNGTCPTYGKTAVVNLVTDYPDRLWCKSANDPDSSCRRGVENGSYAYPDDTYKVLRVVTGAPYYYNVSVEWCNVADNGNQGYGKAGNCQAKKTGTYNKPRFYNWSRVDIKPGTTFPAKAAGRTDCAGDVCTYAEEMRNFATWFSWYRTRIQMTKSAIGLAFSDVRGKPKTGAAAAADPDDGSYLHARVGLTALNNAPILNIADFDATAKADFYAKLYAISPSGGTSLRASLDALGKMYSGTSATYTDPVQYSCQKNFAILATDGYWNDSFSGIGDVDGAKGVSRPSFDGKGAKNTLADVAYYYYHTDLRPATSCADKGARDVCSDNVPPSGSNADVDDVAQHQHMTTFTIGLGVDGTLAYKDGYKNSASGDYYDIKQGTKDWPVPAANSQETIDDLWHAAVNGRGTYFNTRDPSSLEDGLRKALSSIESSTGSGAAAATSNLQPTAGDSAIYIATYRTLKWDGEISAYGVDLTTGVISATASWQADAKLRARIGAKGDTDTRTIYTADGKTRTLFKSGEGGLTAAQLALFDNSKLTQYGSWTTSQKAAGTPSALVNFLRGQDRYEDQDRDAGYGSYERLYRDREKVLGDIVHSQPVYVKAPPHHFRDSGYDSFKQSNGSRAATLYVAANDGMLHAIDVADGSERWAYVPPVVLPNLWRLADEDYGNDHRFFLDGPLTVTDAYIGGSWKTVLIGALGKGGRGYYALDVTSPTDPKPLWNFTADDNPNVGYTYGTPFVAKLADGTWVAILPSGYNNVPEGSKYGEANGQGALFVLNLADGKLLKTITTGVGDKDTPSGLARINVKVSNFDIDDTAEGVYGGDLLGNLWRFDLEAGTATRVVAFGATKPITAAPEIADIEGKKAIYFGTGRYLGEEDLADTSVQTIYGVKDDGTSTITDTANLVQQTIGTGSTTRSIDSKGVDWNAKSGWFVNLPDTGERISLDPQLYYGTLIFASTVPTASACQPGGYGWLYQLNYLTGGRVKSDTPVAVKYTSPIVGVTVARLPAGTPVVYPITADGKKPAPTELAISPDTSANSTRRILWRELAQ